MKITDLTSESVAGPEKCWPGHRKVGTKPGTGKNAGKRVNDCEKIKEQGVAEGLNEFAPPGSGDNGNDGFNEETLKMLAAQWYNGDEDPRVEQVLAAAGWEIGQDEGYDDEPGVFVVQAGDVNGKSYISWPAHELKQGVAEGATADMRAFFAQEKEKNPIKPSSDKVFKSKVEYDRWLEQQKDKNVVKNKQAFKVTEGVIIGPSESGDPMDPQVAVLGGAGSYSLKGLYNKAQRESAQLTKDIGLGNFRSSAYNVKQLENTLNTIVAAHNELEAIRKGGGAKSRGIERGVDTKE